MHKYILKPSLRILDTREKNGNIQIGNNLPLAVTIEKPTKSFIKMLHLLDGNNSVDEVAKQLHVDRSKVKDTLNKLVHLGVIGEKDDARILKNSERSYYARQLAYFSIFPPFLSQPDEKIQLLLKAKKVVIIGLGGGGTHMARELAGIGIGTLILVDGDRVEESNVARQELYDFGDLGKNKAITASKKIKKINPFVRVKAISHFIKSSKDLEYIIKGNDFVILTADEPVATILDWVNEACVKQNIPFLTIGTSEFVCSIGPFVIPHKTSCIHCIDLHENKKNPFRKRLIHQIKNYNYPWVEAVFPPLVSLIASVASFEICRFLVTDTSLLEGSSVTINPVNWTIKKFRWKRIENCSVCNKNGDIH